MDYKLCKVEVFLILVVGVVFECTCKSVVNDDDLYSVTIRMPEAVSTKV